MRTLRPSRRWSPSTSAAVVCGPKPVPSGVCMGFTLGASVGVYLSQLGIFVLDPLSDVLRALRPSGTLSTHFEAAGDWSLRFGGYQHVKFGVVRCGRCFVGARELVAA